MAYSGAPAISTELLPESVMLSLALISTEPPLPGPVVPAARVELVTLKRPVLISSTPASPLPSF